MTSVEWVLLSEAEETNPSTATAGIQGAVALASDASGTGYLVAWSQLEAGAAAQIKGRLFDSDGMPSTPELLLGPPGGHQIVTAVAALPDGRFVVALTDETAAGPDARALIVSADGAAIASIDVAVGAFDEEGPDVTALQDGGYAFSWTRDLGGTNRDIYVSTYNADGTLRHAAVAANVDAYRSRDSSIASLTNGGFVVAWQNDFGQKEVRFRLFDAVGIPLGSDDGVVIDTLDFVNRDIEVAGLPNGGFVVAYEDDSWGNGSDITARIYDADGTPRTGPILANSPANGAATAGEQDRPSLAVAPEGYFVVGWRNSSVECIQAFRPSGTAIGHSVAIAANVEEGAIAALHGGVLAAAWDRQTPDELSVHTTSHVLRRFIVGDGTNEIINGLNSAIGDVIHGLGGDDTIDGRDGTDTIHGGAGNDTIIGGAGDDTAAFSQAALHYIVHDIGSAIKVLGAEGIDTLSGIERLRFADGSMTVADDGNALFDALYYLSRNPDVFHAGTDPFAHFNAFGRYEGRDPNAAFDTSGYLAVNQDVAAGGMNPLEHYHQLGWQQGRDPSANFDTTLYLLRNPDVAAAGVDPLEHYLAFGAAEGRQAFKAVGTIVAGFDAQYYLFRNADVAAAGVDARAHFDMFGWHEGRSANGWFDTAGYLAHYADVAAAGVNPLQHYAQFGWKEGRDPSAGFDTLGYLALNPDVAAANVDPLEHYLMFGVYEGRQTVNDGIWH